MLCCYPKLKHSVLLAWIFCRLCPFECFEGSALFGRNSGKEPACQCRRCKRHRFNPWVGKIPWRRVVQPTLVFLPGKSHGQRSLAGYSPWGCRVGYDWSDFSTHAHGGIVMTPRKHDSDSLVFTRVLESAHGAPASPVTARVRPRTARLLGAPAPWETGFPPGIPRLQDACGAGWVLLREPLGKRWPYLPGDGDEEIFHLLKYAV